MPNTSVDLHLHSYYSDGHYSPADIVHQAHSLGLKTIALTDHDNYHGYAEARNVGESLGLNVIPGIELTTFWENCPPADASMPFGRDVDVLGYYFDPADADFRDFTDLALADLRERIAECCVVLSEQGFPITIENVLIENPRYPGAAQLITALQRLGHAENWNVAYALFAGAWPKVRPCRNTVQKTIAALHAAGGVAVLAHPVSVQCEEGLLPAERLEELVSYGLDGLEVYHPRLDKPARQHFLELAKQFNLAVIGGSDEHGSQGGFTRLGSELVTNAMVKDLSARKTKNSSR